MAMFGLRLEEGLVVAQDLLPRVVQERLVAVVEDDRRVRRLDGEAAKAHRFASGFEAGLREGRKVRLAGVDGTFWELRAGAVGELRKERLVLGSGEATKGLQDAVPEVVREFAARDEESASGFELGGREEFATKGLEPGLGAGVGGLADLVGALLGVREDSLPLELGLLEDVGFLFLARGLDLFEDDFESHGGFTVVMGRRKGREGGREGSSTCLEDEDQEQGDDETEDDDGLRDDRHQEALTEELRVFGHGSDGGCTNRLLTEAGTEAGESDRESCAESDHAPRLGR